MLDSNVSKSRYTKTIAVAIFLVTLIFVAGCNHNSGSTRFASHNVTLDRYGVTNRFGVEQTGPSPIFRYDGYNMAGQRLKVTIQDEKVAINDSPAGMLKKGDSIRITDDGVRVNSLDYGQTKTYLQANAGSGSSETASK
jgi:hypothetical protein